VAIAAAHIPAILGERIESYHPSPALFGGDEVDRWPPGVLPHLLEAGLLIVAGTRIEAVVCPGCEWSCQKALVVRSHDTHSKAYVVCDEQPDLGRIAVERAVVMFVGAYLTASTPRPSRTGSSFYLGTLKGRHGPRELALLLQDGRLTLRVGDHEAALVELLRWEGEALAIDKGHVRRLAARKGYRADRSSARAYRPDRSRQQERSRRTEKRNRRILQEAKRLRKAGETWTAISTRIASSSLAQDDQGKRISGATVRRIISGLHTAERENSRSKRN
jgi:hypothetical protein